MKVIVMNDAADVPLPDSDLDNRMEDSAPTEDNETITISDGVAEINQDNDNMDTQAFMRNRISDIETQIDHIKTTVRVYHQMRPVTQEDNVSKQMSDIIKKLKAEADDLRGFVLEIADNCCHCDSRPMSVRSTSKQMGCFQISNSQSLSR